MQDCCIVLNPNARAARQMQLLDQLTQVARGATIRVTSAPGDAEGLARAAAKEGFRTVIAAGGDGTVNEVLCGIVGTSTRLGVLPVGTVNVFARELGLPLDWEEALVRILHGTERTVDVGWANGVPFAQLAGVGFDAEVIAAVTPRSKTLLGPGAYLLSAFAQMGRPRPVLRVEGEGLPVVEGVWVLVGLGRFYGGPLDVFPRASNTDGLLDVLVVKDLGLAASLGYLAGLPFGWHTRLQGVEYFQTRSLRVEGDAALELDGEARGRGSVDFRVSQKLLTVLT